jgi:predicted glycogen debranching enzyme
VVERPQGDLIEMSGDPNRTHHEWLETDGRGGFASGTALGIRTRRYHSILTVARGAPSDRFVLVNGIEAWLSIAGLRVPLTSQAYLPNVVSGALPRAEAFGWEPWPHWRLRLPDGRLVEHELFMRSGLPIVCMSFRVEAPRPGALLQVRPLISGRGPHALQRANSQLDFHGDLSLGRVIYRPYRGVPELAVWTNGQYRADPVWYRDFRYDDERERGLDYVEDLASPGVFTFNLAFDHGEAVLFFAPEGEIASTEFSGRGPRDRYHVCRAEELALRGALGAEERAAHAYLARRGHGETIVAGYPWFTDWGRDTFIAMRGLCLTLRQWMRAKQILLTWGRTLSHGMLPNCFPDGAPPIFNSVDSSLWYVVAVHELLGTQFEDEPVVSPHERDQLLAVADAILRAFVAGTRHGIKCDQKDGLLASGAPGVALTWMDARVDGQPVTPRAGKPVEVQALWLNALHLAKDRHPDWRALFERGLRSFGDRFWFPAGGYLYDVVDVDGTPGSADESLRPNQIFAVGGLPLQILSKERARSVVDAVEKELHTPAGLRTLSPRDTRYRGRYTGGPEERDRAYHQGTVWPWLMGPFVEAWMRVRPGQEGAAKQAKERFLTPLRQRLGTAGLGHLSEIADGDAPHTPRGCPFQAWSLGEYLRIEALLEKT